MLALTSVLALTASMTAPGFELGLTQDETEAYASERCAGVMIVEADSVSFPLARESETHIVCDGFETDKGIVDRVVFLMADGVLSHVSASGNTQAFALDEESFELLNYQVWLDQRVFINTELDMAWVLNPDGMHTNLFVWRNPLLDTDTLPEPMPLTFSAPPEVRFGASIDELAPELEEACFFTNTRENDPSLPTQPETQTQIDCFGYPVSGFERKIEFVFGDGHLELVWILTGVGEEDRLRDTLTEQFGEAEILMPGMESFADRHVILRTDKPELMMASDAIFQAYFAE